MSKNSVSARLAAVGRVGLVVVATATASLITLSPVAPASAATPPTIVKTSSMNGWAIVDDNGHANGSGSLVGGPGTPPAGIGSARLQVSATNAGWIFAGAANLAGTHLNTITTLSYDTYRASDDPADNLAIALGLNVDYDLTDGDSPADTAWQGRIVFEPYNTVPGGVPQNTWQHWDVTQGNWWQSGNPVVGGVTLAPVCPQSLPCTWAQMLQAYPEIGIHATLGGVTLKAGSGWADFDGNVDNLTIGVNGVDTTYDFEAETPCTTTCYVDAATGNDAFGGDTTATAKKTIQAGLDAVDAGGQVLVAAGTYNESVSITKALTLQGAGVGVTTLHGAATGNGIGIASATSGVTISNLTVTGYDDGIALVPGGGTQHNLIFSDIAVTSNDLHGLFLPAANLDTVSLTNVNASDNGLVGSAGRGVYFTDGTKTNISITGSTFDRNALVGIDLNDGSASGIAITGNEVVGNGDSGIGVLGAKGPGANLIANNTVTNNGRFGIEVKVPTGNGQASGPGSVVVSNNFVTRTTAATDARDSAGIAVYRRAVGPLNADQPSGVVVLGNTVSGYHRKASGSTGDGFGIVVEGLGEVVNGNTVSDNDVDVQIQAGNTADVQNTASFDRGNASASSAVINGNAILTSASFDLRNVGAPTTDATCNSYDNASGPLASKVSGSFVTLPASVAPNSGVPCGVPSGATATAQNLSADVSWNAPSANSGPAVTGYIVTAAPGGATCTTTGALTCTVLGLANGTSYTFTVQATNAAGRGAPSAPTAAVTPFLVASEAPPGNPDFNPITPQRVFDTRPGQSPDALRTVAKAKVGGTTELQVQMTNLAGFVPLLGVGAVSLNITVTNPAAAGFVTAYPCGTRELVASVNYLANQTVSNAAIVPVSATGNVCFFSNVPTDIVVDINGWLTAGQGFTALTPKRVFDTRAGQSPDALLTVQKTPVSGGTFTTVHLANVGGLPATGVGAVSLNVGVTNPVAGGFVTVYPCGARGLVSNVNYATGETVSNAVIAAVSADGDVCFFSSATADLVVDINGWFSVGSDLHGVTPTRVFDTRADQSPDAVRTVPKAKVSGSNILEVKMTDLTTVVPAAGVNAVSLNVTVTNPDAAGYVTAYPCGSLNLISSVNFAAGQTVSNAVLVPVSATGTVCFFSMVPTDIVVDLNGWFGNHTIV